MVEMRDYPECIDPGEIKGFRLEPKESDILWCHYREFASSYGDSWYVCTHPAALSTTPPSYKDFCLALSPRPNGIFCHRQSTDTTLPETDSIKITA